MFGYVAPVLSVLTDEQKQHYRSVYCGVCHALKSRHGQSGRLSPIMALNACSRNCVPGT